MLALLWQVGARPDGMLFARIERPIYHRGVAELRTTDRVRGIAITIVSRINGLVQRSQPTIPLLITHRWHNQQISSARGRDVCNADTLGPLAQTFLCLVVAQFPGSASQQTRRA